MAKVTIPIARRRMFIFYPVNSDKEGSLWILALVTDNRRAVPIGVFQKKNDCMHVTALLNAGVEAEPTYFEEFKNAF